MENKGFTLIEFMIVVTILIILGVTLITPIKIAYGDLEKISQKIVDKEYDIINFSTGEQAIKYALTIDYVYIDKNNNKKVFTEIEYVDAIDYDRYEIGSDWKGKGGNDGCNIYCFMYDAFNFNIYNFYLSCTYFYG